MLKLERHLASGTERDVYLHPHFPDRVIKIRRKTAHADRNFVEYSFHRSARLQFQHIPKCYGWVDTDHGRGLEYELISEEDGSPSCRLTEVVSSGALSASVGSLLSFHMHSDAASSSTMKG